MTESNSSQHDKRGLRALGLILLLALWLRLPCINEGMPFFYNEDEAHHFNRTVEMVKKGEYNPHYFHKPSLHFYLRMPVVAASFLWSVKKGYLKTLSDIKTRDTFGIGDYAFTASHPGIVKWNRCLSVAFSLLLIVFSYLLAQQLFRDRALPILTALLTALSPELVRHSGVIGVDMLMAMLCVAGAYCAALLYRSFSIPRLIVCGLVCGLAVSSKYNALPIAVLPVAACLLAGRRHLGTLLAALALPAAGFLIGTPYALVELPLFLDQFAYEIWHYGVAGHEGHTAEPGLPQALFYLDWLRTDALGIVAVSLAAIGFVLMIRREGRSSVILLLFPVLFSFLMINQKVNFTRNMIAAIPFVALCAAYAASVLCNFFRAKPTKFLRGCGDAIVLAMIVVPAMNTSALGRSMKQHPESRFALIDWLRINNSAAERTAIAGQLQLPPGIYPEFNALKIDQEKLDFAELRSQGFTRVVLAPGRELDTVEKAMASPEQTFAGAAEKQRIVNNPAIVVLRLKPS